jgi:hypothetical protein
MQPTTLRIPPAFMASRMFLVPSDIIVVGPVDYNFKHEHTDQYPGLSNP